MKILLICTLLIADLMFSSGASFAGWHGDHGRRYEQEWRHGHRSDHDRPRRFRWRMLFDWDDDDRDAGRQPTSSQTGKKPTGNKFILEGTTPKATIK